MSGNLGQATAAGVIQLEALSDDGPIALVHRHGADVLAERSNLEAGVDVAERCEAWRTAEFDFLTHPLLGLFAQVGGVPFGNIAHNAVDEPAGRAVVDVLSA